MSEQVFGYIVTCSMALGVEPDPETKAGCWAWWEGNSKVEVSRELEGWAPTEPLGATLVLVDQTRDHTDVYIRVGTHSALLWIGPECPIYHRAIAIARTYATDWERNLHAKKSTSQDENPQGQSPQTRTQKP